MKTKSPKVLLIGGSGFIGSAVLKALQSQSLLVHALWHNSPVQHNEISIIRGDVRDFDWNSLSFIPDIIIHCGRISGRNWLDRWLAGWQGAEAHKRLIAWLYQFESPPKLVFVSGTLVYGSNGDATIDEDAPVNPIGFQKFYARAEQPFLKSLQTTNLSINIVRAPWVLGNASWFKQFYVKHITDKGYIPVFGDGENIMSVVHIDDCARFILQVALTPTEPGVINMAVLEPVKQREFCKTLSIITKVPTRNIPLGTLKRKYGRTVAEALTFSLHLVSKRTECEMFNPSFKTLHDVMSEALQYDENF